MDEQDPKKSPDKISKNSPLSADDSLMGGQFLLPKASKNEEKRTVDSTTGPEPNKKSRDSAIRRPARPYSDTSSGITSGIFVAFIILIGGGFFGCLGGQVLRIFPKLPENMMKILLGLIFVIIPACSVYISIMASSKGSSVWSSEYTGQFALLFLLSSLLFACFVQNLFTARSL